MKHLFLSALIGLTTFTSFAQRTERLLDKGWRFTRTEIADATQPGFDDRSWSTVSVPHDWAITGPFSYKNDKQKVAISQDGQKEAMEHAGRTGGLPFVGVGWYRLHFTAPEFKAGKRAFLLFDGAMSHPQVYLNGQKAGEWANGYNSFWLDVTSLMKAGADNLLAVRLENKTESSRWYPGAGLYRNVHLYVTDEVHIPLWGVTVTTPKVSKDEATVTERIALDIPTDSLLVNTFAKEGQGLRLETRILSPRGQEIDATSFSITTEKEIFFQTSVADPQLWTTETPALYTLITKLYRGSRLCDSTSTRFGIRSIALVPEKGFLLNGEVVKFRGVCNHHDLGPLGAAVNMKAIRRQIRLLKEMGCNAIRTSHNMPAPELVEACDEMGMMLMCESFDEWSSAKCANGYHLDFNEWVDKDLTNLVRHYRNNPSVMMWSIGNEVPDQGNSKTGPKLSLRLQNICHREDPTRPVTQGMDNPDAVVNNNMAAVMDIPGFNYRPFKYQANYDKLPQGFLLGTETASTISSRGVYKFPVTRRAMPKYDDHQASSYDVEHCSWSDLPEDNFIWHEDRPWSMGEFVWTGFDYLGEPTPYYSDWPSHSSLFGIIDLAGIPKDRYYLYRSHWAPDSLTLHVLPHWTWPGREGKVTPVFVYTNQPSAELFINGMSQGRVTKDATVTIENSADNASTQSFKRQRRYRLMWPDVKYEPGTIKVVAYDAAGKAVAEESVSTAGPAVRLEIIPETSSDRVLRADGKDISFLRVRAVDKDGNLCPTAANLIQFSVSGAGAFRASANGDAACLDLLQQPQMHLFSGELTLLVQSKQQAGDILVKASAKGLKAAETHIVSK